MEIKEIDKIYFAGLFDGEGSVYIFSNNESYTLKVNFTLCYLPVLERAQKIFKGSIHKDDMEKYIKYPSVLKLESLGISNPKTHKQRYSYIITNKNAWIFLKAVEPYLMEKKEEAIIAIEYYNKRKGGTSKHETERGKWYKNKLYEIKNQREQKHNEEECYSSQQTTLFLKEI